MNRQRHRLVVARRSADLDWVDRFDAYTICNKGGDDLSVGQRANSVRLADVGGEPHSYIYHIVNNYDRLEDVLTFIPADRIPGLNPVDLVTVASDVGEAGFSEGLADIRLPLVCNRRSFSPRGDVTEFSDDQPNLGGWWERTTGEGYVRSRRVFWNSIFSVSRELIHKRSRESYVRILEALESDPHSVAPLFCERLWFNIMNLPLGPVAGASALTSVPSGPSPVEKDVSFDLSSLVERRESIEPPKAKPDFHSKIKVRFTKPARKPVDSPILSGEELLGVLDHVGDLMLSDEETVRKCTEALRHNIEGWTRSRCPRYPFDKPFACKADLEDKTGWYVPALAGKSTEVGTTGSTTGMPFKYMRWHSMFHKIEWDYHHNLVLDEFGVCNRPNVLYFFSDNYKTDGDSPIACFGGKSDLAINNHGSSRDPITHHVNFRVYQRDGEAFFRFLFDYVQRHRIDVFFTSPPQISSMCNFIRKFGVKHKIGGLLSSTGDRMVPSDVQFLFVENQYFDHICDHMRCWDGGASFYTCRHGNYHLMDNLCWVEEVGGKMICTDYFNLSSPFVRYWNGDYCQIGKEYKRCECGRLYREFKFMESRPFSLKGVSMNHIKQGLKELEIPGIREVRCSMKFLDVVSKTPLSEEDRARISALSDSFEFRFLVEEYHS